MLDSSYGVAERYEPGDEINDVPILQQAQYLSERVLQKRVAVNVGEHCLGNISSISNRSGTSLQSTSRDLLPVMVCKH